MSVIILNWNRIDDTLSCLESLKKQTFKDFETIVVDNGSHDTSKSVLEKRDDIIFIDNPTNRGFTGGHIDGSNRARGEYIFVLNNDAIVDPHYIEVAVKILTDNDNIAVVGGRSYQWRHSNDKYKDSVPYYAFQKIDPITGEGIFEQTDQGFTHCVNWVSGSAMVVRKEVLRKTGYFYEPFFAYYEESDLFARMLTHGFKIVYSPDLKIWHKDGSSSTSLYQFKQLFRNRYGFVIRNFDSNVLPVFLKAHTKLLAKGFVKRLLDKGATDTSQREINHALTYAALRNIVETPRLLHSRNAIKKPKSTHTYSKLLQIERVGLSFVLDANTSSFPAKDFIDWIKSTSFNHYNIEYVLVCAKERKDELNRELKTLFDSHLPIRIAVDEKLSNTNTLNIGWLSCSKQYIIFCDQNRLPDTDTLSMICSKIYGLQYVALTSGNTTVISRSLLSTLGGLVDTSNKKSLEALIAFANIYKNARHINLDSRQIVTQKGVTKQRLYEAIEQLSALSKQQHRLQKLLDKNYRLYQLYNLSVFLTSLNLPVRLRVARSRNLVFGALTLNKKKLAKELRHMNDEAIRSRNHAYDRAERAKTVKDLARLSTRTDTWKKTPVFIICRDRVSTLEQLIAWCESAGLRNIYLIDNDSIFPPLLDYFEKTPYQVIRTGKNIGHTVVWHEGIAKTLAYGQYYIVSDPDVIPEENVVATAIPHFYSLHAKYHDYLKVGFGLKIDDLPDSYSLKRDVVEWEKQFWINTVEKDVYIAGLDTTFALYKPYTDIYTLHPSLRTGRPYVASHLPWYVDSKEIDEEEAFYRLHASKDITSWNTNEILQRYKKALKKK